MARCAYNAARDKVEDGERHPVEFYDLLAEFAGEYLKKSARAHNLMDVLEQYRPGLIANEVQMLGGFSDMDDDIPFCGDGFPLVAAAATKGPSP